MNSDESRRAGQAPGDQANTYRRLGAAFVRGADRYERLRPDYPDAAVDWLVDGLPAATPAADIGAGTGKLSAALVDRDLSVTAIDPSTDMLSHLQHRLPGVRTVIGTGEATGLADRSIRLATFGQSWHWVDPEAGVTELNRILGDDGRVGWLWNFLDEQVDWVAGLVEIWHSITGTEADAIHRPPELPSPAGQPAFGPIESTVVEWTMPMTLTDLTDLLTTRSYYLAADETVRRDAWKRSATFLTNRFGGTEQVGLPYRTRCYRCTRSS